MAACVYLLLAFFAASGCEGRHAQPLPSFTIAAASREAVRPAGNVTARYATTTADVVPVARRPGIFKSIRQFFADWHNSQLARLLVTCCVYWMAFASYQTWRDMQIFTNPLRDLTRSANKAVIKLQREAAPKAREAFKVATKKVQREVAPKAAETSKAAAQASAKRLLEAAKAAEKAAEKARRKVVETAPQATEVTSDFLVRTARSMVNIVGSMAALRASAMEEARQQQQQRRAAAPAPPPPPPPPPRLMMPLPWRYN